MLAAHDRDQVVKGGCWATSSPIARAGYVGVDGNVAWVVYAYCAPWWCVCDGVFARARGTCTMVVVVVVVVVVVCVCVVCVGFICVWRSGWGEVVHHCLPLHSWLGGTVMWRRHTHVWSRCCHRCRYCSLLHASHRVASCSYRHSFWPNMDAVVTGFRTAKSL